jgi:hypothetical protein
MLMMPGLVQAEQFDAQLVIEGNNLYLNGEGPRKKAFITVYDTALYLTEKGSDASAIIAADHPMAISLIVRSALATAKRISSAFEEGLEKSTGGNTQAIAAETVTFLAVFEKGVVKNDAFQFVYLPGIGTKIYKNGESEATIEGAAFKQALFGIWLSDDPISGKLKSQLLGQ